MACSDEEDDIIIAAASVTTSLAISYYNNYIVKTPCRDSILSGSGWVSEVLNGHDARCQENYRMKKHVFLKLCNILETRELLRHTNGVRIEEQVAIFMYTVGQNQRNRINQERFQHSGETISRHFNNVLNAIVELAGDFFQQPRSCTPPEISGDGRFYPYFKDCIGAIDGTHIPVLVNLDEQVPFRNRKGNISQNVLVACSFDLQFQYVLAGWEGSATDSRVLNSALTRPNKLHVPEGKYYLVDAGYANTSSFIAPYRGTRYHLKEFGGIPPENPKELFNLRHSSLRNAVERIIGILKKRFAILRVAPPYPFEAQVKIVMACCILHNHIRREKRNDVFFEIDNYEDTHEIEEGTEQESQGAEIINRRRQRQVAIDLRDSISNAMWQEFQRS